MMKKFIYVLNILCLLVLLTSCGTSSVQILFPLDGATLQNPVTLEANQTVTWYANGKHLGAGQRWQGQLASGEYIIIAKGTSERAITVTVPEAFPLGEIRSFEGSLTPTVELPKGNYALIWGNTTDKTISLTPETEALTTLSVETETLDYQLRQGEYKLIQAGVKKFNRPPAKAWWNG